MSQTQALRAKSFPFQISARPLGSQLIFAHPAVAVVELREGVLSTAAAS